MYIKPFVKQVGMISALEIDTAAGSVKSYSN